MRRGEEKRGREDRKLRVVHKKKVHEKRWKEEGVGAGGNLRVVYTTSNEEDGRLYLQLSSLFLQLFIFKANSTKNKHVLFSIHQPRHERHGAIVIVANKREHFVKLVPAIQGLPPDNHPVLREISHLVSRIVPFESRLLAINVIKTSVFQVFVKRLGILCLVKDVLGGK